MRFLGLLLFLLGAGGTGYATWIAYTRGRPLDVVFASIAPVAALLMLLGLVVLFVPGFL